MMLTNLADILRGAGLNVVEVDGWRSRSTDGNAFAGVRSIICHWTATNPAAAGDYPTRSTILNGNGETPGPLAQLGLGRSGTWYVFAAGVAWHAGVVDSVDHNNWHAVGIEAEYHPAQGAWPEAQQRSYERGCAALAKAFNVPVWQIQGHYEVARPLGRKSDPNTLPGGMPGFRDRVAAVMNEEDDPMPAEDPANPFLRKRDSEWLARQMADFNEERKRGDEFVVVTLSAAIAELSNDPDLTKDEVRQIVDAAEQQQTAELRAHIDATVGDVDEEALADALAARGIGGASPAEVKAALAEVLRRGVGVA